LVDVRQTAAGPGYGFEDDGANGRFFFRYLEAQDSCLRWDKPDGLLVRRFGDNHVLQRIKVEPTDWFVNTVRLSRDNRFVSSHHRHSHKLIVWQVDGDAPKELLNQEEVRAAMFVPDRAEIVIYTTANDLIIQPLTGKEKPKTLRLPELVKEPPPVDWPWECEPGPNRQVAVAGFKHVHVIDLEAGKVVASFPVRGGVSDMRWSHDGATLAVSCWNDALILYDAANKTQRSINDFLPGGPVNVGFDPSGRYLLANNAWTWRNVVVNVATSTQELRFNGVEPAYKDAPLPVGFWFQLPSAVPYHVVPIPPEMGLASPEMCAIHPGGRLLASPTSKGIALSDVATGRHVGLLPAEGYCNSACFDADGNLFAARTPRKGASMIPTRWPISVQGNRYQIGAGEALVLPAANDLDVSRDGRIVAVTQYTHSLALDRQTGKTVKLEPQQDARRVAVSPDGSLVATFSWEAEGFRVWKAKTGKLVYVDAFGTKGKGRFTADGKYLVTAGFGDGSGLRLWSVPDLKLVRKREGAAVAFALSPDGHLLAIAEASGKISLVRMDDNETLARFDAPGNGSVVDITFSPDGRYLVGLNLEWTGYHVWDLGLLRQQLRELKLDWEKDPLPKAAPVRESIVVEIAGPK
jgi:WD40 repeat protein